MNSALRRFLPGILLVLMSLAPSTSPYIGDTQVYAESVMQYRAGQWSSPFHPLWEFGHLLWRPAGALLAPVSLHVVPDSWTTLDKVKIAYGLLWMSFVAALGVGALLYDLFRRLAGWKVAALLTFGVAWANGFLLYALSGSSYIPGLLFSVAAVWVLFGGMQQRWRQLTAGVLAAVAALFWFPYILTIPALAVIPWAWNRLTLREGGRILLLIGLTAAACILAGMTAGALAAGVREPAEAVAWYQEAPHDWQQNRRWVRAVSGIPRLLLDLSRDGIVMKRYVLRDPFQSTGFWDLARQSLWKLAWFYAFIGAMLWMAARTVRGRAALLVAVSAGIPMLGFAIFLFEPSSAERFLPMLPFLLLAGAAGWSGAGRWVAGLFLVSLPVINASAFIEACSDVPAAMAGQLEDVRQHAEPDDLLVTVTFSDPFAQWLEQRIFHPSLRQGAPPTYQLLFLASTKAEQWREDFALRTLQQWETGKDVWIRRGALRDRPDTMLQWVEGDHPRIRWADVTAFLTQLGFDRTTERPDGFTRVAKTENNRKILEALAIR